ncbi:MAG: hypothetical protein HQL40_07410, partial [Alphaproteobacteria bacterium]|nr:hypothetical protein [Alphaproteobacteria bacterium]
GWRDFIRWAGLIEYLDTHFRKPLQPVPGDRFSLLVARLEGDRDGVKRRELIREIESLPGLRVVPIDRIVLLGGWDVDAAILAGHDQARRYVAQTGASAVIWGTAPKEGVRSLHWTPAPGAGRDREVPHDFWSDKVGGTGALVANFEGAR